MYLYLSVFMNFSHLGVIHVAKRIHTFSIWGEGVENGDPLSTDGRSILPPPPSVGFWQPPLLVLYYLQL